MSTPPPRALLYGDVDLNIIDGSAIWAQSMAQALAAAGCEVTLLLKAPVRTDRLIAPLATVPGVHLLRPYEDALVPDAGPRGLTPEQAVSLMVARHERRPFDLVVVRGRRLAGLAAQEESLAGRLWTYLTDFPHGVDGLTATTVAELTEISLASRFLLCQTEELRAFLESSVPAACGRSVLFPPVVVVPEDARADGQVHARARLAYTGKFAQAWNTLEMTGLPAALERRGVESELVMIGDKIHADPADWSKRMRKALEGTPGVDWRGGMARADALRASAECDFGLSWRDPSMDASLELSTKVLELGALGLPVVLNRTPMHEALLGSDYPLFAGADLDSVAEVVARAYHDRSVYADAAARCRAAAGEHTLERAAERLRGYLTEALPPVPTGADPERPLKVVVAGHDMKFFTRLAEYLSSLPGLEVRIDEWEGLGTHDQYRSRELAGWADVVICEWCGPNALFYAKWKRPDQRLIVRLHRFELYAEWPRRLDIDKVDAVVCVSPHYADLTREITGWPADKVVVVPNWVDDEQLARPKLPGAEYSLGMIGIAPSRKRMDRGLDVLAELRRMDPRYTMSIKTKQPWDYWWIWNRPEERAYFERVYRRVQREEALAGAVVFDPFGPDVSTWLRRVGFMLSTSDDESFHLAPAECAASGGVPALLPWPGADTIYDPHWIHDDAVAMAEAIHAVVREGRFEEEAERARAEVIGAYSLGRVRALWTDLVVLGTVPASVPARA
ncbi:glycosyltransferase [Nocardiopsis sp. N85]|uniref:glycosyltransferase n=1 Tax=Nocardiopsis sp. N85 TaxID=3029400 RepID=UPI00237FAD49|nr:glycosyltransferase [Nocardiopsis sp. N85]MDE3721121.1 glycosyltransferase [Nocardiopsis sp. N85]